MNPLDARFEIAGYMDLHGGAVWVVTGHYKWDDDMTI